jgi:DNA-binding MarR family transcriptional regulator
MRGDRDKRDTFARRLAAIGRAVARIEREQVCCGDLTFQQFETLRRIDGDGNDTVSAVSSALGIDESTASRNLGILVRDGYLKRSRDRDDGRRVRLVLTGKARAALTELSCDERDVFAAIFDRLAPDDRAAALAALSALEAALEQTAPACCPGDRADSPRTAG